MISYGVRQIFVILLTFGYNIILTRFLLPAEFGKVAVIMIVVNVAVLLADGGFGVYLIQRRAEVNDNDLARVATVQLYFSCLLTSFCFMIAVTVSALYGSVQLAWMVAVASVSLPFLVIRGMSLLLLERSVQINKTVRVELLEEGTFAVAAIFFANYGAGAWSVVIAMIFKALVGSAAASLLGRFRLRIVPVLWDQELRDGFRFGMHYQAAQLINMARVSIIPLFIIPVFGFHAGGLVERSLYFASAPLSIILAVQKKTMFPFIARIQQSRENLRVFLGNSIYASSILDKFMFLPLALFAREIVMLVFGEQWLPMLPLLYWLIAGNVIFGALAGTLYPAANGIGRSDLISKFNLIAFIISWLLMVPFTLFWGIQGVGIAALVMWGGIHWLRTRIKAEIGMFPYYVKIIKPVLAFLVSFAMVKVLSLYTTGETYSIGRLAFLTLASYVAYVVVLLAIDFRRIFNLIQKMRFSHQQ
ncbi:MAG: hypothetical protein A2X56_03200 [Nitrospirae bacterium GWC2_57_13]|nr:MAG: hypothetical protein A2X56_03200 [Nitrospirae bacterium GWC2_57_13]